MKMYYQERKELLFVSMMVKAFEVECFDANGDSLDVVTTLAELLDLVEEYQG